MAKNIKLMTPWNKFFREKIKKIFIEKKAVLDIGAGLRILKEKGDRYDLSRQWILPYLNKVDYKIMDIIPDYHPDIIGDIHQLPFDNDSQEAIICMSVLQHIENPIQASKELHRVLKPNGYCFLYVPFLYYYHAKEGGYKDYWRFSKDAIGFLFKDFSHLEIKSVRGALGTWLHISPLGRSKILTKLFILLDKLFKK